MQGTIEGSVAPDVGEESDPQDDPGMARRRRRIEHGVIAALVVVVLAAIALLGFTSGGDDDQDRAEPVADKLPAAAEAPSTTAVPTTEAATPTTEAPTTAPTTEAAPAATPAVLEDGRHPVFLTGLDTTGRTLEVDVVQWLTGDAATDYVLAHPDEYPGMYEEIEDVGSYPYDSLVVNDNTRLRTLPVAGNPQIMVLLTEYSTNWPHTIDFDELPAYLDAHDEWIEAPGRISNSVFWVTVDGGEIVGLEEQFQA